jgi:glycosyltransferase involved in cell wall biosynthesis
VRVLIFHGYLLGGTGSNVYNSGLAAALARAGHEVHLLCQERSPFDHAWVDAMGDWDNGALEVQTRCEPARATVYRPDIAGLLPVYVADRYEGVEARPFQDLSDAELDRYLERNVAAVREVAELARPDAALANHIVMGPLVLARGLNGLDVPYAVKIHGSALEYTVKPHPRFMPHAREGLAGARGVLVGSRHTAESLWEVMEDPELEARTRLGPPGVDIDEFTPRPPAEGRAGLRELVGRLATAPADEAHSSSFSRDNAAAAVALETLQPADRLVVFVGKLMGSKGVELLVAAWPLVLARVPEARLLVVGFGALRKGLEQLVADLAAGDLEAAAATRGENGQELPLLTAFLKGLDADHAAAYFEAAANLAERIAWTGRLEHSELAELLPVADAMVVPSTFPEAFGMVAAEAAACGALPVVARHSGLAEVAETLSGAVPAAARDWLSFALGPQAVADLAAAVAGWLEAPDELRAATREAMVAATRERYSWDGVARTVLAAAEGRLEALPSP